MAGAAFRVSARTTSGLVLSSSGSDRRVFAYVEGKAKQRIAFSSGDQPDSESGFLIPEGGIEFILESGDAIYMAGQTMSTEASYVYFMITKVV